jgi:hypothetical protein
LWLALLWFAAPVFTPRDRTIDSTSRIRDTVILGVAIPGLLAFVDALYWWTAIALGVAIAGLRIVRRPVKFPSLASLQSRDAFSWRALPLLGVIASAWPGMVRPLLDGDSLSYHLPNAAAWVHAHGLWVTNTRYWWYPGGSELFAAGTFDVAGPYGLPICGAVAMLLLGQRVYAFAIRASIDPIVAASISTLLITAHAFLFQAANLENDVWLSAFLVETLWCLRYERDAFARTVCVATLIKPIGFAFVAALCLIARAPLRFVALASLGIVAWILRDLALLPGASIPLSASAYAHPESTTIVAHGFDGFTTLLSATLGDGLGFSLLAIALLVTLAASPDRVARIGAAVFSAFFLVEPFGFNTAVPQLASGHSLRFLEPALVLGTLGVLPLLKRANLWVAVPLLVVSLFEVWRFEKIFVADSSTSGVFAIVVISAVAFSIPNVRVREISSGLLALSLIAYAARIAGIHPAGYYDAEIARPGVADTAFTWLRDTRPPRVVAWSFRSGPVDIVTPHTEVIENFGDDACTVARRERALLLEIDDGNAVSNARTLARSCGRVVFEGPAALIVQPQVSARRSER